MMSSLSNLASSLNSMQKAIDVVSNNIANANTPRFSRSVANLTESSVGGVSFSSTIQFSPNLLNTVANAGSSYSKNSTMAKVQDGIQQDMSLFNSQMLQNSSDLKSAYQTLSVSNNSLEARTLVDESFKTITSSLNSNLNSVSTRISDLGTLNSTEIAKANSNIRQLADFNKMPADFKNSSEGKTIVSQLVSSISESVGATARFTEDGSISLTVGNSPVLEGTATIDLTSIPISTGIVGGNVQNIANLNALKSDIKSAISEFANSVNTANSSGTLPNGTPAGNLFSVDSEGKLLYNGNSSLIATVSSTSDTVSSGVTSSLNSVVSTISGLTAREGSRASYYASTNSTSQAYLDSVERRMDEESGVDLNEQAVKLAAYQKNYEAIAKLMQVQNEMFGTIINIKA